MGGKAQFQTDIVFAVLDSKLQLLETLSTRCVLPVPVASVFRQCSGTDVLGRLCCGQSLLQVSVDEDLERVGVLP